MGARTDLARKLRVRQTDAEKLLWSRLRNRQLAGLKFKRQIPIDRFVADFACADAKLIVELDGGQHGERSEADFARTQVLEAFGYLVLRFWNNDVLTNIDGVLETILSTIKWQAFDPLTRRASAPTSPQRGEVSQALLRTQARTLSPVGRGQGEGRRGK